MDPLEAKTRIVAALEQLAELREDAIEDRPVSRSKFAAALAVAASILDGPAKARLADVNPAQKTSLDVTAIDKAVHLINELVDDWLVHKAALPSKAQMRDLAAESADYHAQAADNLRWVIEAEDRAHKARLARADETDFVERWLNHGENRVRQIARLRGAGR